MQYELDRTIKREEEKCHMFLTVEQYNTYEEEGRQNVPNKFLEAFQSENFETVGFPSRIRNSKEIYKFLDSMHDGRLRFYYEDKNLACAPTYEEFETIKTLSKDIYDFSAETYGRGVVVKAPILAMSKVCRKIKALSELNVCEENMPTIFEIGAGNGVLGIMLHRLGYKYISTDVTQAFYLEQNNLWEGLDPDCVMECFDCIDNLKDIDKDKMIHIPYWKLWELRNTNLEADIVVSNDNLLEMTEMALRFYLQYSKQLMRNSEYKLFVAWHPGSALLRQVDYLLPLFDEMGYALLYSERFFVVFALKDKKQILPAHIGDIMAREHYRKAFPVWGNPLDKTAAMIYKANQKAHDEPKVPLAEIEKYFYSLDKNPDTEDEEFIHYCGYEWR